MVARVHDRRVGDEQEVELAALGDAGDLLHGRQLDMGFERARVPPAGRMVAGPEHKHPEMHPPLGCAHFAFSALEATSARDCVAATLVAMKSLAALTSPMDMVILRAAGEAGTSPAPWPTLEPDFQLQLDPAPAEGQEGMDSHPVSPPCRRGLFPADKM